MLGEGLDRSCSNLLRKAFMLSLRSVVEQILFLVLEFNRILSYHGCRISSPLVDQIRRCSTTPSILIEILTAINTRHHLALPLHLDDSLRLVSCAYPVAHLSHLSEDVVEGASTTLREMLGIGLFHQHFEILFK